MGVELLSSRFSLLPCSDFPLIQGIELDFHCSIKPYRGWCCVGRELFPSSLDLSRRNLRMYLVVVFPFVSRCQRCYCGLLVESEQRGESLISKPVLI